MKTINTPNKANIPANTCGVALKKIKRITHRKLYLIKITIFQIKEAAPPDWCLAALVLCDSSVVNLWSHIGPSRNTHDTIPCSMLNRNRPYLLVNPKCWLQHSEGYHSRSLYCRHHWLHCSSIWTIVWQYEYIRLDYCRYLAAISFGFRILSFLKTKYFLNKIFFLLSQEAILNLQVATHPLKLKYKERLRRTGEVSLW